MALLIIFLTPVLVVLGSWLAFRVGWWLLKSNIKRLMAWEAKQIELANKKQ